MTVCSFHSLHITKLHDFQSYTCTMHWLIWLCDCFRYRESCPRSQNQQTSPKWLPFWVSAGATPKVAAILGVAPADLDSEWKILRRLQGDLSSQDSLITLATSPDKCAMFPVFSSAVSKLLLLPVGTATVERSFSTTNRSVRLRATKLCAGT